MDNIFYNTRQAADYLSLQPGTLEIWRFYRKGPKYLKFGRAIRYRQSDLDNYIEESVQEPDISVNA